MTPELDKKLCEDFPLLYADRYVSMKNTAMCFGIEVHNGWEPLIRELSAKLEKLIEKLITENPRTCFCNHGIENHTADNCIAVLKKSKFNDKKIPCDCKAFHVWHPKAFQVKEKFGGLRYYLTSGTDEMHNLISKAEQQSFSICEVCSKAAQLMSTENGSVNGWLKTLCFDCLETNAFYKLQKYAPVT